MLVLATKPGALGAVAEETRVTVPTAASRSSRSWAPSPTSRDRAGLRRRHRGAALHAERRGRGPRRDLLLRRRAPRSTTRTERSLLDLFGLLGELVAGRGAADGRRDRDLGLRAGILRAGRREPHRRRREAGSRRAAGRDAWRATTMARHRRAAAQAPRRACRLRRAVTSPGGVTAAGVARLEDYRRASRLRRGGRSRGREGEAAQDVERLFRWPPSAARRSPTT